MKNGKILALFAAAAFAAHLTAEPSGPVGLKGVTYSGGRSISVMLDSKPDMDLARSHITVEPLLRGKPSFNLWPVREDGVILGYRLDVSGEFAFRTNVTLTIRKGFLDEEYVETFKRPDLDPSVGFADSGRYLPPFGGGKIALASVNCSNVAVSVRSVPSANIVQMLALEEDAYENIRKKWWVEGESFVSDLSAKGRRFAVSPPKKPNEMQRSVVSILPPEKPFERGVYFVTISPGSALSDDDPHRVVCVTDLGLTVRKTKEGLLVWTCSLTSGKPVPGAVVEVYSTANVLVAKGVAGADGLCRCVKTEEGEPFAVVARTPTGDDSTFMALADGSELDETYPGGGRAEYLSPEALAAFAWTERGIYRHGERIYFRALVRNGAGAAPRPLPLDILLFGPDDTLCASKTVVSAENGSISCEDFSVPDSQPSGNWTFYLRTPGKDGRTLASRRICVEEFVPPQVRVSVEPDSAARPANFSFGVSAEHLFGGGASSLLCEGAVMFEDVPFTPDGWGGFSFGDSRRALKPNFRNLEGKMLDANGKCVFSAGIFGDAGKPSAAVRATAQAVVTEDGGRHVYARGTAVLHEYPHYVGTTLRDWMAKPSVGRPVVSVACVKPDGSRLATARRLVATLERSDRVFYYCRDGARGGATWKCDEVVSVVDDGIEFETKPDGDVEFEIPADDCADYILTISDPEAGVAFSKSFYLGGSGEDAVRAPLSRPTAIDLSLDKAFYRPGDVPRLRIRSPFAGTALLSVFREGLRSAKVLSLENATEEIALEPVSAADSPNLDVSVLVLHGAAADSQRLAARAHGETTVCVRPKEAEIAVAVDASVETGSSDGGKVSVSVAAPGADEVVVAVVDEGINLLTNERVPDPVASFASPRTAEKPCYDIYGRILPAVDGESLFANGAKTGGGFGEEMLSRVSMTASRRFKPLSKWKVLRVENDVASAVFDVGEFVGEVRVTALANSATACGAAAIHRKVAPKLVSRPDAPRFTAPGDQFDVTLPLTSRAGEDGEVAYCVKALWGDGATLGEGTMRLKDGATEVLTFRAAAPAEPGTATVRFTASGFGESHTEDIELPIRPAAAWRGTAGMEVLEPGASFAVPTNAVQGPARFAFSSSGSRMGELKSALEWLADYPHGCLEQTSSRIFPLVTAGGVLNALGSVAAADREKYVAAGVRRVESMIRKNDFVMWPDCNYAPWDREVSLYAAHFLVEAEKSGVAPSPAAKSSVMRFLSKWALSTNTAEAAYACHTLALAGKPDRDRMLKLYGRRATLSPISRARLARAFAAANDRARAEELVGGEMAPEGVKDAAFMLLALNDLNPEDARIPQLVGYLMQKRQDRRYSWGTTAENAHALLALGAYWRNRSVADGKPDVRDEAGTIRNAGVGTAFVSWKMISLPPAGEDEPDESSGGLSIRREFLDSDGKPYDMANAKRGDFTWVAISLKSAVERDYSDLVIEDLYAAAFEPVRGGIDASACPWAADVGTEWVMRSDARDDRMLVFSKKFHMKANDEVKFLYPARIVSSGEFALPATRVEAMYSPGLNARAGAGRVVVRR